MHHLDDAAAETFPVIGVHSIAHLVPKSKNRCGIYLLRFSNGDRYVGQAVDVVTRFSTHRLNYPDITEVAFWRVPQRDLDAVERAEIRRLEDEGVQLRNVVHARGRLGATDFDIVVPPPEQEAWLGSAPSDIVGQDTRPQHAHLRRDNHVGFSRLVADPRFATVEYALRRYVSWTIPAPHRTELSYWTISARPGTLGGKRLFTLTVHNLETLFLYAPRSEPDVTDFRLNVDLKTLLGSWDTLDEFADQLWGLDVYEPRYRARPGVAALSVDNARDFVRLLSLDGVVAAARRLNVDLMRKGPALNWKSHCLDLADRLLAPATAEDLHVGTADPGRLVDIGSALDDQGRFEQAQPLYARAAEAGHAAGMFRLGILLDEQGERAEAERWWHQAAEAGDAQAMYLLGLISDDCGDTERAASWWRRAADAGHSGAAAGLGELIAEQGDLAGAEAAFRRAVELDDLDTALVNLGALNQNRGDLQAAEEYYRRAVDQDNTEAMLKLGLLLQDRGELPAAEVMFQRAHDAGDAEAEKFLQGPPGALGTRSS